MIINENELMEDLIEGIAEVLDLETHEVRPHVYEADLEECITEMFEAETNYIHSLTPAIKDRISKQEALAELETLLESVTDLDWDMDHIPNWTSLQDSINKITNYVKGE
jgi:hypothetical protein